VSAQLFPVYTSQQSVLKVILLYWKLKSQSGSKLDIQKVVTEKQKRRTLGTPF
jgi:hypothetical protein